MKLKENIRDLGSKNSTSDVENVGCEVAKSRFEVRMR